MSGMDRNTGKLIDDWQHVQQSIEDILTTPIGSRCMNRRYGSALTMLIGKVADDIEYYAAIAESIDMWHKDFKLTDVQMTHTTPDGVKRFVLKGSYKGQLKTITRDLR